MIPSSALPLAYYLVAYVGFGAGLAALAADPSLPGASFYQPRFIALVHLLTLAWLTGSILGSLYIAGPLALRVPMRVTKNDWMAFSCFVFGTSGMVAHFWINTYDGMAWSAMFVVGSVAWVGVRVWRGSCPSTLPPGVRLHIALAFFNFAAAAAAGMVIGFDRSRGFLSLSPLSLMFAHAHVAAVGWVTMLVIGLSYRLLPMMLPASMPSGPSIALSAILLEAGLIVLTWCLVMDVKATWLGALMIVCGVGCFIAHVRRMLTRRVPRPPALPARDWSTWQVHIAFAWLVIALAAGVVLSIGVPDDNRLPLIWIYATAGLVGFLAQMVAGMQGRLVPLYVWYRAAASGAHSLRSANTLPSAAFARFILLCWAAGVPLLAYGLPQSHHLTIRTGAIALLFGLCGGAAYIAKMTQRAREPAADKAAA